MNFLKFPFFHIVVVFQANILFAQINTDRISASQNEAKPSFIIRSSSADTSFLKVEYSGAHYDALRKNLPFLVVSKTTPYDQEAKAGLIIRKASVVNEPHASVIRKYFGIYLKKEFSLEKIASLSGNENLNFHQLLPFRFNQFNQIEELLDYEIVWQVTQSANSEAFKKSSAFKSQSVLATGDWYKIGVTKTGLYKMDKNFIEKLGIDLNGVDPRNIRVYGNGGKMLPERNGLFRYDDLEENAIYIDGENDGVFDDKDYLLFYATGTEEWKKQSPANALTYEVTKSLYSDSSFYFLTVDGSAGKRVINKASSSLTPNAFTSTYDFYGFHEDNRYNFGKSGRDFYGEFFDVTTSYTFGWNDGDFVVGDTIRAGYSVVAIHTDTTQFLMSGNGIQRIVTTPSLNVGATYADYATPASGKIKGLNTDANGINIQIQKLTARSLGYLDKLTVNARRNIRVGSKQFQFRDSRVSGPGKICEFTMQKTQTTLPQLWNVTDPLNAYIQQYSQSGNTLRFVANADSANEYCLAPENDYFLPKAIGKTENQNLHSISQADYLIITHPSFLSQANRLAAFHATQEGYSTAVVTVQEIYNEFSSGKQDISAIRDFIRMLYTRGNSLTVPRPLKYVLLMGDGSFNNMVRSTVNNSNFIPTYQSIESLSSTSTLATDDFYGLMDPLEGANAEGYGVVDVGIGRFTCKSSAEVNAVISKIENYYKKEPNFQVSQQDPLNCAGNESPMGDWRNNLLFLADDGDGSVHMKGADNLTNIVSNINETYNTDKIYIDAYQRISTPSGQRYPDAEQDLMRKIRKGVLLFNYTGHGGEMGLTAERILDIAAINSMDNFNKLPLFITATCEFSRYDDPGRTSAGELCLTNPSGAAIALLTTCRLAYSSTNDLLNSVVMDKLFNKLSNGKRPTLGDVIKMTKASPALGGQRYYYANFHLLGDPALTLAYPENKVSTAAVNNQSVTITKIDTLGALAKITVSGVISDTLGNKLNAFNGVVYSTVFDKEQDVTCLLNDPDSYSGFEGNPFKYKLQRNTLFRGKTQVTNGEFSFTFLVPKDISFAYGPGKITYYATNGVTDANGYYNQLVVGGASGNTIPDSEGPQINLYMNDKNFVSGSITNETPLFYADLIDSSGINTLGTSFGHDITAVLNKAGSKPIILNDYYEAALNSYQSGRVRYPFDKLSTGDYQLNFKVWDIQNNSSMASVEFVVAESAELALKNVLNYPNPFSTKTKFFFEHNQACNPLKVSLQIYTISGKQVKTIQKSLQCEGFRAEGIDWDGRDDFGDKLARGVYVYRLSITTSDNKKAEKIEKLVILN